MPGRFKDYIANRKANGYQSTTVYADPKARLSSLIRPRKCMSRWGLQPTGLTKKGVKVSGRQQRISYRDELDHELMELQDQSNDAKDFVDSVKRKLSS